MSKAYIAGPMSGYPQFNFPMFDKVRDMMVAARIDIVSPADIDRRVDGFDPVKDPDATPPARLRLIDYMARDLPEVEKCDSIIMLPGWEHSMGANLELEHARKHSLDVYVWNEATTLAEAACVKPNEATLKRAHEMMESERREEVAKAQEGGKAKHMSAGKPPVQDVPRSLVIGVAEILHFGANIKGYGRHNWRRGTEWSEFVGSALRHLLAWNNGEDVDPESGISHLKHCACNLAFLIEYEAKGLGTDDRVKEEK